MKAVLMDGQGQERGLSTAPTPFVSVDQGVEMPFEAMVGSLGRLLAGLGESTQRVAAVGVAGVAESGAGVDERGRPVSPVIAWHDPRGGEVVDRILDHFGDDFARRIGQSLRTVSSVAKLGWLIDQGRSDLRSWVGVPELCLFHLTGAQATEHSLAARTGCYHVLERRWMPDVIDLVVPRPGVFPEVMPAGAVMGQVSLPGSAWSSLPEGVPVTIAGHDHLAGAEGLGAGADDAVNSVGTAETVMRRSPAPPDMDKALSLKAAVTVRPGGDEWVVLASAARAGLVLDAVARLLDRSVQELDELAAEAGQVEIGDDTVRSIQDGRDGALPEGTPGEVWNGLLHALSRRTMESAERLEELLGQAERIIVFGGGSRSIPWMRAKAGVSHLPVLRTRSGEAVARGAACMAGVAAGWWPSTEDAPTPPLEPASSS